MPTIASRVFVLSILLAATACAEPPGEAGPAEDSAGSAPISDTLGASSAGSGDSAAATGELVATVNGVAIPLSEFQRQAFDTQRYFVEQGIDPNTDEGQRELLHLRRQVLDDMINQQLIEQAATELGLTADAAEVTASLAATIEQLGGDEAFEASLAQSGSTRAEVEAMERAGIIGRKVLDHIATDIPTTAEHVHARHILCETEAACQAALVRLTAGEDFAAVAKEVSTDEASAQRGGDLDWIAEGMLPSPQLGEAIFALQAGERSAVVQTDFGYHILEVIERDPARELSAEQQNALREKRLIEWLNERRAASDIVIHIDDLKAPAPDAD